MYIALALAFAVRGYAANVPTCQFGEGAAVPLYTTDQVMDGGFTRYCTWYTAAHVGQIRISTVLQQ